jgi:CSLREA domain-containing protein
MRCARKLAALFTSLVATAGVLVGCATSGSPLSLPPTATAAVTEPTANPVPALSSVPDQPTSTVIPGPTLNPKPAATPSPAATAGFTVVPPAVPAPALIPTGSIAVNTTIDEQDGSCSDGDCSLRDALALAKPGNAVQIPVGTYTLTLGSGLTINQDLALTGAGAETTFIQAATKPNSANFRVLNVGPDSNVTISGVTIRYGNGGISMTTGRLTLINSTVSGNSTQGPGGGIRNIRGILTLSNSTVNSNIATGAGGAIYNEHGDSMSLTNSTVIGNIASEGGGIYIGVVGLDLVNSTVSGNIALNGGGIYNDGGFLTLNNSTVSGNTTTIGVGGGILNQHKATLINSTVSDNTAQSGGGIISGITYGSTIELVSTIIAGNTASYGSDCFGNLTSQDHNLIGNDSSCSFIHASGDLVNIDPKLGPLRDSGGYTFTHALLPGSPAIDAGDNTLCPVTDQRGMYRPQGKGCDIGAFEGS